MTQLEEVAYEVLNRLGRGSTFMSDYERKTEAPLACEVVKETLLRAARDLIEDAGGRPVLTSKSCDGTPITVAHRSTLVQPGGKRVKRSGRQGQEFLVANQFLRLDMGGAGMKTKVLLAEPTPLQHGKAVPAILLACRQHWRRLRDLGHLGCAIEHYCWDRMGIIALETQTRQWHAQQPLPMLPPLVDPEVVKLTEFVCVTACALHDAHNSLKWAMYSSFTDKEMMRDIYIGFESLRRSSDLLSKNIFEWLGQHLHPCEDRGAEWTEARLQLWMDLGVDPETSVLLAQQLQLQWDGQRMHHLQGAFSDGDLPESVASALLAVWRFAHFSESRWLTVGTSCRTMVAAHLTGIASLVKHIKKVETSLFFLRGFDRLVASRLEFMVTCAVASRVAEGVQTVLMRDNRVAKIADSLWDTAAKEVKSAISIPDSTYALLGKLCDRPGAAVKDDCINAAHISFHFFHRRVLVPAGELPWCLCRGDIERNLDDLAAQECPDEPVSKNLWLLMQRRFHKVQLVKTVALLGEVGWTSLPAEQQHASLAMLHKWHPEYEMKTLVARSLLLQAAKLLPSKTKEEKEAEKLVAKLDRVLRANPEKVRGRQMLVASMVAICSGKKDAGAAGYAASMDIIAKRCVSRHMTFWAQQSWAQQQEWHHLARRRAHCRQHLLQLEFQTFSAELAKVDVTIEENQRKSSALTMKSAALDAQDLETFGRLWNQPEFRARESMAIRRADVGTAPAFTAPPAPGPPVWLRAEVQLPAWAKPLVRHRGTFRGSALVIQRENGAREFWKIVFAVKSPAYLALCQLHPMPAPAFDDLAIPLQPLDDPNVFSINFADCKNAADLALGAKDQLSILFRLNHEGGTRVTSDMDPLLLEYVLCGGDNDMGPVEEVCGEGARAGEKDHVYEKLVTTSLPWLEHLDTRQGLTGGGSSEGADDGEEHAAIEDEDHIWAGLAALERARVAEAAISAALPGSDFVSKVRGGRSMAGGSGDIVHAMQGQCCGRDAERWARERGQSTFKATFSEHGTVESKTIVRAWCHRMQYFLIWRWLLQ